MSLSLTVCLLLDLCLCCLLFRFYCFVCCVFVVLSVVCLLYCLLFVCQFVVVCFVACFFVYVFNARVVVSVLLLFTMCLLFVFSGCTLCITHRLRVVLLCIGI